MTYQYKREPLTQDEANSLANACQTHEERLVIWTLLDTGLRVSELASLNKNNIDWQNHRLIIYGKGVLRHTFSVTAIQKGISTRSLQEVLGHSHLATTEIYLNLSPEDVMREFRDKW